MGQGLLCELIIYTYYIYAYVIYAGSRRRLLRDNYYTFTYQIITAGARWSIIEYQQGRVSTFWCVIDLVLPLRLRWMPWLSLTPRRKSIVSGLFRTIYILSLSIDIHLLIVIEQISNKYSNTNNSYNL